MGAFMKSGDSNGEHRQGHGEEEIETVKKKKVMYGITHMIPPNSQFRTAKKVI